MMRWTLVVAALAVTLGCASKSPKLDYPAYRPEAVGEAERLFRDRLRKTSVVVFPTVVRSFRSTEYDEASRDRIGAFFEAHNLATVHLSEDQVDLSASAAPVQWKLFQQSMSLVAAHLKANPAPAEYAMLVECLVTPTKAGGQAVGGLQCYILDAEGRNAFSFLLNSHHRLFVDARLSTGAASEIARANLARRSTDVVVEALRRQLGLRAEKRLAPRAETPGDV